MFTKKDHLLCIMTLASSLVTLQTEAITIYRENTTTKKWGYNAINMHKNGEENVIKSVIKEGWVVFDVGAAQGDWSSTVQKYHKGTSLFAFEPIPNTYHTCKKRITTQHAHVFNIALGDDNKETSIIWYATKQNSNCSSLFRRPQLEKMKNVTKKNLTVQVNTLDSFCKAHNVEHIDFLKIDAEGSELAVLQGAHDTLQANRISVIQFEYGGTFPDAGITLKQVYELLDKNRYSVFRIVPNGLLHIPVWYADLENNNYANYLAIATQKVETIVGNPLT